MIKTSTRPARRRAQFGRWPHQQEQMHRHIGPSKYMPHIGKKQLAKAAVRVG